jgi:hypothetical protein
MLFSMDGMHFLHVTKRYLNLLQHVAHAVYKPLRRRLKCYRWGQHMHHGYYEPGKQVGNQQAQIDMIERTLDWAGVTSVKNVSNVVKDLQTAHCTRLSTQEGQTWGRHRTQDALRRSVAQCRLWTLAVALVAAAGTSQQSTAARARASPSARSRCRRPGRAGAVAQRGVGVARP